MAWAQGVSERIRRKEGKEGKEGGGGQDRTGRWGAHAPVRVPGHAEREDGRVGEEGPEEVEDEEEVGRRPRDEPVELGRAAPGLGWVERRVGREGRRWRRRLVW